MFSSKMIVIAVLLIYIGFTTAEPPQTGADPLETGADSPETGARPLGGGRRPNGAGPLVGDGDSPVARMTEAQP